MPYMPMHSMPDLQCNLLLPDGYNQVFLKIFSIYQAQKEVYGDVSDYYATDPFHEGGNKGGMSEQVIARKVLASMMEADADAIWIIQYQYLPYD